MINELNFHRPGIEEFLNLLHAFPCENIDHTKTCDTPGLISGNVKKECGVYDLCVLETKKKCRHGTQLWHQ